LTALSISFTGSARPSASKPPRREPSAKRKRLHLLYLLHDLLHHAKYHINGISVASKVQPSLEDLFSSAASFRNCPKQWKKIQRLLDIWEERDYYSRVYIERLREVVKIAPDSEGALESSAHVNRNDEATTGPKFLKSTPFAMPAMHGDQGVPWYDLPAGNLLPHIVPNSTRPINPTLVKPLRFTPGPADKALVNAVKDLLQDVNKIFDTSQAQHQSEDAFWDIDELGQVLLRDEITGEIVGGEGYYGWSKGFCERMKRYGNGHAYRVAESHGEGEGTGPSRSISRSSSRSHRVKRRRYSDSGEDRSRSRSRSRTRFDRRSYSSSQSPPRVRGPAYERESQLRTTRGSTPDSRSREMDNRDATKLLYQSRSPSRHSSPDGKLGDIRRKNDPDSYEVSHPYEKDIQMVPSAPQNLIPSPGSYGRGVILVPPPPQYQGQWPPPSMQPYVHQAQAGGVWPPPPPAFPHGAQHWQSTSYGQPHLGSNPWTPNPQHERNDGGQTSRDRGWPNASQQLHQSEGSAYNGYRGSGRGRGRGRGWS
jgi:CID domain